MAAHRCSISQDDFKNEKQTNSTKTPAKVGTVPVGQQRIDKYLVRTKRVLSGGDTTPGGGNETGQHRWKRQRLIDEFLGGSDKICTDFLLVYKSPREFHRYMAERYHALCLDRLPLAWFKLIFDNEAGMDGGDERRESVSAASALHEALSRETRVICPQPMENIWRWAALVPDPQSARVVIIARGPYHETVRSSEPSDTYWPNCDQLNDIKALEVGKAPGHTPPDKGTVITMADGLAFSVNPRYARTGKGLPYVLTNIMMAADTSFVTRSHDESRFRGDLSPWAEDGVLLLNSVLTTVEGSPDAHAHIGWQVITDRVIERLGDSKTNTRIFMLWGSDMNKKRVLIDHSKHVVMSDRYPCGHNWLEKDIFKEANLILRTLRRPAVCWSCRRPPRRHGETKIQI